MQRPGPESFSMRSFLYFLKSVGLEYTGMRTLAAVCIAAALLAVFADGNGWAFHEGGVGACEGCHTMHNSIASGTTPFPANGSKDTSSNENAQNSENPGIGGVSGWTGTPVTGSSSTESAEYLLRGSDPSSTCLNCHEETGDQAIGSFVSTAPADMPNTSPSRPPIELTPGGDFGWLKKSYSWSVSGSNYSDNGDLHGHNIAANDFNYSVGPDWNGKNAPGGAYPASDLTCISCHDPHGTYRRNSDGSITNSPGGAHIIGSGSYGSMPASGQAVGVYRMLSGKGYLPLYLAGQTAYAFNFPSPAAVSPTVYNQSETGIDYQVRVAYGNDATNGGGMSDWCRNCHPDIHTTSGPANPDNYLLQPYSFPSTHPSGTLTSGVPSPTQDQFGSYVYSGSSYALNYDQYIMSGDYNTGYTSSSPSYSSLVPFEEDTVNYQTLSSHANNNGSYLDGPSDSDFISCMSCHRAHASGWDYALRYKYNGLSDGNNGFSEVMTNDNGGISQWPGIDIYSSDPNNLAYAMGRTQYETQKAYYDRLASMFAPNQKVLCNKCHIGSVSGPRQSGY